MAFGQIFLSRLWKVHFANFCSAWIERHRIQSERATKGNSKCSIVYYWKISVNPFTAVSFYRAFSLNRMPFKPYWKRNKKETTLEDSTLIFQWQPNSGAIRELNPRRGRSEILSILLSCSIWLPNQLFKKANNKGLHKTRWGKNRNYNKFYLKFKRFRRMKSAAIWARTFREFKRFWRAESKC